MWLVLGVLLLVIGALMRVVGGLSNGGAHDTANGAGVPRLGETLCLVGVFALVLATP